jgi:hypothetical protein
MWQAGIFNSVDLTATNLFQNNARTAAQEKKFGWTI